jgi:hypothetical protein
MSNTPRKNAPMDVALLFSQFMQKVDARDVEIYNEFSLQHEFGLFLRSNYPAIKIQFERNVAFFGLEKSNFEKREIDICAYSKAEKPLLAVELKFPRNGQYPEQLFSFCKDVVFLEQLRNAGFAQCAFVAVVEDRPFFAGQQAGIYSSFRGGPPLHGEVLKPTGKRDKTLNIVGSYPIVWQSISDGKRYLVLEV